MDFLFVSFFFSHDIAMDAWAKSQRRPLPGSGVFTTTNSNASPSSSSSSTTQTVSANGIDDENSSSSRNERKEHSNNNVHHQKQLQLHPQQQLTSSQRLTQQQLPLGAAAQRAHRIHTSLVAMYKSTNDPHLAPSTISYNAAINAWSKSYHPSAGEMAELLLGEMMREWRFGNDNSNNDDFDYLERSEKGEEDEDEEEEEESDENEIERRSKRKKIKRHHRGNERVKPDVVTFTAV